VSPPNGNCRPFPIRAAPLIHGATVNQVRRRGLILPGLTPPEHIPDQVRTVCFEVLHDPHCGESGGLALPREEHKNGMERCCAGSRCPQEINTVSRRLTDLQANLTRKRQVAQCGSVSHDGVFPACSD
jgi:hypothetical protein